MTNTPVTVGREDGSWFDQLCVEQGLEAVAPLTAVDLWPGHYLFSAVGTPLAVKRVRRYKHVVRVTYADGQAQTFENDAPISLVAVAKVS